MEPEGTSKKSLVDALHRFLLEARAANRNVVLLIDEAQDLSAEVLEQIRLISNLETDTEKLIQIILMGQSELRDMLARRELRQLAQRVTARYHLAPLSLGRDRGVHPAPVVVAGGEGKVGFTGDALTAVHRLSGGVPRLVNLVCDRALLAGYVQGSRTITAGMVRQAAREVRGERPGAGFPLAPRPDRDGADAGSRRSCLRRGPSAGAGPGGPGAGLDPGRASGGADGPDADSPAAAQRPAGRRSSGRAASASFAAAAARVRGRSGAASALARTALRTHLEQLRPLDLPVVLEMFHPARRDTCFVALLRLDERAAGRRRSGDPPIRAPLSPTSIASGRRDAVVWWPEPLPTLRRSRGTRGLGPTEPLGPRLSPSRKLAVSRETLPADRPDSSPTASSGPAP